VYAAATQEKFLEASKRLAQLSGKRPRAKVDQQTQTKFEERLKRQMKRMADAKELQRVRHGDVKGERRDGIAPRLSIGIKIDRREFNWTSLRELVADAKANGFSARPVDDAFLYYAAYSDEPAGYFDSETKELTFGDHLTKSVANLFPQCIGSRQNSAFLMTSIDHNFGDFVPPHFRPYLWYEIPRDSVIDLLWGRLLIVVAVNMGRLIEALEAEDIKAKLVNVRDPKAPFAIEVKRRFRQDIGEFEVKAYVSYEQIQRLGFEFMTLAGFVDQVKQMLEGSIEVATKEEDFQTLVAFQKKRRQNK